MMRLFIFKEVEVRLPRKKIEVLFKKLSARESKAGYKGQVNIIFSPDSRLKSLNKRFRKINKSTDVLSFNIDTPDRHDAVFGEIYISVPTAVKQAVSYEASLNEELLRLCCHGLLHLFGYDHVKKQDEIKMKKKEEYYIGSV